MLPFGGMVIVAIIFGAGIILVLDAVVRAPIGYQDETGFHVGVKSGAEEAIDCKLNPN